MNYSNPENLAIIACPGAEVFADKVVSHLRKGYRRNFDNMIAELSTNYGMEDHVAARQVNFLNDVLSSPNKCRVARKNTAAPDLR